MQKLKSIHKYILYISLVTMCLFLPGCAPPGLIIPLIGPREKDLLLLILIIVATYVFIWAKNKRI